MDKDRSEQPKRRWDWLPMHMPGVAKRLAEKRAELGDAWVDECWRRGVIRREPGWFCAIEGALMVGVLVNDPVVVDLACARISPTQFFLMLRDKDMQDGS